MNKYMDRINGIEVTAYNKTMAIELILDECHDKKLKEPNEDDIFQVITESDLYYEKVSNDRHCYKFQPEGRPLIIVTDYNQQRAKATILNQLNTK